MLQPGWVIRKNGLNMRTCNIIYWAIVMPILTLGREIWHVTGYDYESLITFQIYAGWRLQRLSSEIPTLLLLFWSQMAKDIIIKKLLFALSIMRLDDDSYVKMLFCQRVAILKDKVNEVNVNESPTMGILIAANRLGLLELITGIARGDIVIIGEKSMV